MVICRTGSEALDFVRQTEPRCLILDVMLPGKDGFEICEEIRRGGSIVPILFLSARADEPDRVDGLRAGADDYLVKPFSPRELVARVDALLRRSEIGPRPPTVIRLGNVELSPTRHEVAVDGLQRRAHARGVRTACGDAGAARMGAHPWPVDRPAVHG